VRIYIQGQDIRREEVLCAPAVGEYTFAPRRCGFG